MVCRGARRGPIVCRWFVRWIWVSFLTHPGRRPPRAAGLLPGRPDPCRDGPALSGPLPGRPDPSRAGRTPPGTAGSLLHGRTPPQDGQTPPWTAGHLPRRPDTSRDGRTPPGTAGPRPNGRTPPTTMARCKGVVGACGEDEKGLGHAQFSGCVQGMAGKICNRIRSDLPTAANQRSRYCLILYGQVNAIDRQRCRRCL